MLRIFSQINILSLLLLPLIIAAYLYLHWNSVEGSLYAFETEELVNLGVWGVHKVGMLTNDILCFAFVLVNATLLNYIFNKQNFYEKNSLLPGFIYAILLTNVGEFYIFDGALILHTFLILATNVLFRISFNELNFGALFNFGLFLGIGATFSPKFYLALPLFYILILLSKPFKVREFLLYITGWAIPQFYAAFFLFFYNILNEKTLYSWWQFSYQIPYNYFMNTIVIGIVFISTLVGANAVLSKTGIQLRKFSGAYFVLMVTSTLVAFALFLFFKRVDFFHFLILPLSLLFSVSLLKNKSNFVQMLAFYIALIYSGLKFFFN